MLRPNCFEKLSKLFAYLVMVRTSDPALHRALHAGLLQKLRDRAGELTHDFLCRPLHRLHPGPHLHCGDSGAHLHRGSAMSLPTFDKKDPAETVMLTWDFSAALATGETLTGTPSITLVVQSGIEDPPALTLVDSPSIDGTSTQVQQVVSGGTQGISYGLKATVSTSNAAKVLALAAVLPVSE